MHSIYLCSHLYLITSCELLKEHACVMLFMSFYVLYVINIVKRIIEGTHQLFTIVMLIHVLKLILYMVFLKLQKCIYYFKKKV